MDHLLIQTKTSSSPLPCLVAVQIIKINQFFGATTQSSTVFESAANTSSGIIEGGASSSKIFKNIRDLAKTVNVALNNEEKEEIEYVADDQAEETTFVLESPQLIRSPPC